MKFNMETAYIPYATIFEKRDMMFDWKETSERSAKLGWIFAIFPILLSCVYYDPFGDFFEFSMYKSGIMCYNTSVGIFSLICNLLKNDKLLLLYITQVKTLL